VSGELLFCSRIRLASEKIRRSGTSQKFGRKEHWNSVGRFSSPGRKRLRFILSLGVLLPSVAFSAFSQSQPALSSSEPGGSERPGRVATISPEELPDAPQPQIEVTAPPAAQNFAGQIVPARGDSSSRPLANGVKSHPENAADQIKEQEKQRIFWIMPAFNVTNRRDAVSLSAGQKMRLALRSSVDPFAFASAFLVAGYEEAADQDKGFGWGPEGYFKRSGAAYLDTFDSTIIAGGILPVVLHQDPRYYRLAHGSFPHRLFYAISRSYVCKGDNTNKWEPNYSNIGGNIIAGAISNLYYPGQNSGWGQTITNGLIVITEGTLNGVLNEFWPDISRKVLHKDPTHGLDAQAAKADNASQSDPYGAK
jgi:hypothetical protein